MLDTLPPFFILPPPLTHTIPRQAVFIFLGWDSGVDASGHGCGMPSRATCLSEPGREGRAHHFSSLPGREPYTATATHRLQSQTSKALQAGNFTFLPTASLFSLPSALRALFWRFNFLFLSSLSILHIALAFPP